MKKRNPVKKNMDKFHKPRTHKDKTQYDRRSESQKLQDELEPIINDMIDEGGPVWHPTEHDESDDLEEAKRIKRPENVYKPFNGGKGG